jgi:hypothetical protein
MKKFVFATVMALASVCLLSPLTMRAQDSDQITIKDPVEFNAYQMATTQSDPKAKAAALENFLTSYPQSVVKKDVLIMLVGTYQGIPDPDHELSAASRLLQIDPNNFEAILYSALIKKSQCGRGGDAQTCDDAAALAQKGLTVPKPSGTADADWKKQTDAAYPLFHSTIALDDVASKKDFKGTISEYRTELMLYAPEATQAGPGLVDTLQLAEAYIKQEAVDGKAARDAVAAAKAARVAAKAAKDASAPDAADKAAAADKAKADAKAAKDVDGADYIQAIWFYSRAWNFAPASYKSPIEQKIEYYYKKYHGAQDAADVLQKALDGIKSLAVATVFPPASYTITPALTPEDIAHNVVVSTPDLTQLNLSDKEFILANASQEDQDKLWAVMQGKQTPIPGVVIDASTTVIKLAVTDDAKTNKVPDFIVNLKTPLTEKEVPAKGAAYGIYPADELDGTYDTYKQVDATDTTGPAAEIVLKDGAIQAGEKKKPAVPAHKPSAAHHAAATQ